MSVQSAVQQPVPKIPRRGSSRESLRLAFVLLLPGLIVIALIVGFPMLYSLYLSFTDYTLTNTSGYNFVGLQNYLTLAQDPVFWQAFGRTVLFMALAVNLEFALGLIIAQMMAKAGFGKDLLRTILMMPMMFAPILVERIFELITEINGLGVSVLLVEQNANVALQTASYGYVLETGTIILNDDASILIQDEQVRKAYLGIA